MIYDVAVLGLGGMGSAAAASCARRGLRVLGIERFHPGHVFGSSHGRTRLIRQAYFEHEAYVPLLLEAYALWRNLETETGEELLRITGLLLAGHPEAKAVVGSRESARIYGLPIQDVDAAQIRRRFPMMRPMPDEVGVFEPNGGVVFPEKTVVTMTQLAEAAGADLYFGRTFAGVDPSEKTIHIELDDGSEYRARKLVSALGAWSAEHAPFVAAPMRIQRNVQAWFVPASRAFVAPECPAFFLDRAGFPAPLYGMPDFGDGVKAAFHGFGSVTSAAALDRTIDKSDVAPIQAALNTWMPGAARALRDASACMYSLTPDEHFVIGLKPNDDRVVLLNGFSGHGFKFVPLVGEICADLVQDGATARDIAFLSPNRAG